jgi:hypothetical protein
MLSVTVDLSRYRDFAERLPVAVERAAVRGIKRQLAAIQRRARREHRFMSTSGKRPTGRYYRNTHMLEKSVEMTTDEHGGMVYLDTGIAAYGPYVHEGQRSWAPDQFIYGAFDKQLPEIQPAVEAEITRAMVGF